MQQKRFKKQKEEENEVMLFFPPKIHSFSLDTFISGL